MHETGAISIQRILKGFHPSAQGCRACEATLGQLPQAFRNPEGVESITAWPTHAKIIRAPWLIFSLLLTASTGLCAEATNSATAPLTLPPLPDAGPSILRVLGALALVIGIFLGGAWLYRNWQRLTIQRGRAPKLNVIETRALGGKHALYVIGYDQERFLLASSPNGVNLLTHLPAAEESAEKDAPTETTTVAAPSFAQALTKVLKGK